MANREPSSADGSVDEVRLPRTRAGSEPQFLLSALFGDYWFQRFEAIPGTAIVALLAEFGITPGGARQAALRLSRRGVLQRYPRGRETAYGFRRTRESTRIHARLRRILGFGATTPEWDGLWTIAAFTLPEAVRVDRAALRAGLRRLGFGVLQDAMWVSPFDRTSEAAALFAEIGVREWHTFRATSVGPGELDAHAIFDTAPLREDYVRFIAQHDAVARGDVEVSNPLVYRSELMSRWLTLQDRDPDLPGVLLGDNWPRARAHEVFLGVYDRLGPPAARRFREILASVDPELAPLAGFHTSELLREPPADAADDAH